MRAKGRQSRFLSRRSSTSSLVFMVLITACLVILVILALCLLSFQTASLRSPLSRDFTEIVRSSQKQRRDEVDDDGSSDKWIEVISWEPRAVIYHNFLSEDECDYLINLAKPDMRKSTVIDPDTGRSIDSSVRTSSGTFLDRGQDEKIKAIEKRIADFTFIPVEHGEGLQILNYKVGQQYEAHADYFVDDVNIKNGGQRIATVLMYLSDVEEGGETVFPEAKGNISSVPWWNELSECGKGGLAIKPKKGNALLFWSMNPDATPDPSSLHAGCPVIKGDKWSSTKWLRFNEYNF